MKKFLINVGLLILVAAAVFGWILLPWFGALYSGAGPAHGPCAQLTDISSCSLPWASAV